MSAISIKTADIACIICHEVADKNVCLTRCMHNMCEDCSIKWISTSCPVCRDHSGRMPNTFVNRIVGDIVEACPFGQCQVERRDVARHRATCQYRPVGCVACTWSGQECAREAHELMCPYVKSACLYCHVAIPRGAVDYHHKHCTARQWLCSKCSHEHYVWERHDCVVEAYLNGQLDADPELIKYLITLVQPETPIKNIVDGLIVDDLKLRAWIADQLARDLPEPVRAFLIKL